MYDLVPRVFARFHEEEHVGMMCRNPTKYLIVRPSETRDAAVRRTCELRPRKVVYRGGDSSKHHVAPLRIRIGVYESLLASPDAENLLITDVVVQPVTTAENGEKIVKRRTIESRRLKV